LCKISGGSPPDRIKAERAKHGEEWDVRRDIKPLQVIQPEGVSFEGG
jgi:primary-amine oxidase